MERALKFAEESLDRYGVWIDCFTLMPDHTHLIVSSRRDSVTIGNWVKAFKALIMWKDFRWQRGFFDHVIRGDESRSEKWAYIRENPVRAGLVRHPDDWPYSAALDPRSGDRIL